MSVQKAVITVSRFAVILWVPLHVHVIMDSHWPVMEGLAMVCIQSVYPAPAYVFIAILCRYSGVSKW